MRYCLVVRDWEDDVSWVEGPYEDGEDMKRRNELWDAPDVQYSIEIYTYKEPSNV